MNKLCSFQDNQPMNRSRIVGMDLSTLQARRYASRAHFVLLHYLRHIHSNFFSFHSNTDVVTNMYIIICTIIIHRRSCPINHRYIWVLVWVEDTYCCYAFSPVMANRTINEPLSSVCWSASVAARMHRLFKAHKRTMNRFSCHKWTFCPLVTA